MRLTALSPQFLKVEAVDRFHHVESFASAQGICFLCPCGSGHQIFAWFKGRDVPTELGPRWDVHGTGYADLTLVPSVDTKCWHGHVREGEVS